MSTNKGKAPKETGGQQYSGSFPYSPQSKEYEGRIKGPQQISAGGLQSINPGQNPEEGTDPEIATDKLP